MSQRLALNGDDWQFKAFYGEDWRWRDSHESDTKDIRHWYKGSVPGSVQHDLWQNGEIPNPYFERNSLLIEWIPQRTWIYKKTFTVSEALRGKRFELHFEGVDYEAEFFLNGVSLGHHIGMYTPAVFDVTEHIQFGKDNLLAVVIEPAPHEQPQVGCTRNVRTHKSRMTYWWDFCPRMIHIGIWDDVYLQVNDDVTIEDVFVRPQLNADYDHADVQITVELTAESAQACELEINLRFDDGVMVSHRKECALQTGVTTVNELIELEHPRLWWPNGSGQQSLYQAEVRLFESSDQTLLDDKTVTFGIRDIHLVANEQSDPNAMPYTFVVNGQKTYIKGWNWVPMDVMYGVPRPEKLDHLLQLVQRAHVNLLRVWGGGLIEKEAFYQHCDELGIMVWQEFIQSSSGIDNYPPEEPEFIKMMVNEAERIIPRKRNHPSLVIWCGGNELTADSSQPLDNTHPLLAALASTVSRLDPDRIWLPTSPTGPVFMNSIENVEQNPLALHDVHGPWEYQGLSEQYELYNRSTSLFHSEFGVEGLTNLKSLNRTIVPEHQWPVTLDNPIWQHLGAWWVKQSVWQKLFGDVKDVKTLIQATQFMQAEGLRYAVEADRRREFQNSGTLPWQFNEPYPMAACTSAVDYYGQAKPAYYAVARAYEAVHVSAKFPTIAWGGRDPFQAEIWVNSAQHDFSMNVEVIAKLVSFTGDVLFEQSYPMGYRPNQAARVGSIEWSVEEIGETIFFLDLSVMEPSGRLRSENRYLFTTGVNLAPLFDTPVNQIQVERIDVTDDESVVKITNVGQVTALGIWLESDNLTSTESYLYFSDNYFSLLPHESRSIVVNWGSVKWNQRGLVITGWNIDEWKG